MFFFPVLISQKKTGICEQKLNIQDGHKKEAGNDRQNVSDRQNVIFLSVRPTTTKLGGKIEQYALTTSYTLFLHSFL